MATIDITTAIDAFSDSRPEVQRFREIGILFSTRTHRVTTNNKIRESVETTLLLKKDEIRLRQERENLSIINTAVLKERFPSAFNVKTVEVSLEFFNHFIRKGWTEKNLGADPIVLATLRQIVKEQGLQKYDLLIMTTPTETRRHHIFVGDKGLTGCTTGYSRLWSATTYAFWLILGISPDIIYQDYIRRLD